MSIIGIYHDQNEIVMMSDGMAGHFQTDEVISTDHSKIYVLNKRAAILHMGSFGEFVNYFINELPKTEHADADPEELAKGLGVAIGNYLIHSKEDPTREFLTWITGFNDSGSAELWQLFNGSERATSEFGFEPSENPFIPVKKEFQKGDCLSVASGMPETPLPDILEQKLDEGHVPRLACSLAFTETIKLMENPDCGGVIFQEILMHTP